MSVTQMRTICERSDVWKALRATLAFIIELSTTHTPRNRKGHKRPGAEDLWQAPYLGVVEVFVTSDHWMHEAISKIAEFLPHRRRVLLASEFIERLMSETPAITCASL